MIASLSGLDFGPQSFLKDFHTSRWQKNIISSTSNKMLVEFRSDSYVIEELKKLDDVQIYDYAFYAFYGFSAFIHYSQLPSIECEAGLDMSKQTIQSPKYPDSYDNNLACKWLISVPHGFHITLKFLQFDVGIFSYFQYLINFLNIYILGFFATA